MIFKIEQTASNIKQEYDITGEAAYSGANGKFYELQESRLSKNGEPVLRAKYSASNLMTWIPIITTFIVWLIAPKLGISQLTAIVPIVLFGFIPYSIRKAEIVKGEKTIGYFEHHKEGYLRKLDEIKLDSGDTLKCYTVSKGSFTYLPIYKNGVQIALVETYTVTVDYKYTHKLYLLDEYADMAEVLLLFILYYANLHYTDRHHMSTGTYYSFSWTTSPYKKKYDPAWREKYFPEENYFGLYLSRKIKKTPEGLSKTTQ